MADVNANIGVNIDTSEALGQLKNLQRQISQFHTSIAKSSEAASLAQRDLQRNFLSSVNSIGAFSAELRTVKTTSESFTTSLEKNKFSMREYFRYAGASTKTFGRLFKSEFDTIGKVAEDRVKTLQTQYIKMGRDASGAMKAIAIRPDQLDMGSYATQLQLAAQKQALFNQLMKQGSTNLLNFGKNTQWAGRQLMVGFSLPLMAVGSAAAKSFMQMEAQALRFKKVYGDLFTTQEESQQALSGIEALGKEFTKYGIAVADTVGLAADAAAAGFQGIDLQRQTTEATRLSVLGQIDNQQALATTIALQNAFSISSADLAQNIDFLNAVENQTVVSLDDITTAIPKVAPVIQQLGGDVKDLAFFLTAMKEGGVNASEGANALKSGLAALINPSTKASAMLKSVNIDINAIVNNNKGDLKATVVGFAKALDTLAPLDRARAIEQMFGKFQFARLSTLFQNVTKDGTQAARVLDLAGASVEDLAALSDKELGITAGSAMNKFKKAVEDLKVAIIPVGEAFLKTVTPILDFVTKIAEKFSSLSDRTKKVITVMVTVIGGLGPILLMTFGLLANGIANIIKLFLTLRTGYQKLTGQSKNLGEQTQYMTMEQLEAAASAHSLNQAHATLTQQFNVETTALNKLIAAYQAATLAASKFAMANPGMMLPPGMFSKGGIVRGPGGPTDDNIPIMASNGEAVIPASTVNSNKPIIDRLLKTGKFESKLDLNGASGGGAARSSASYRGVNNLVSGTAGIPQMTEDQIRARNERALAQIEANKARRMGLTQGMVAAPALGGNRQVNVPGTYHSAHFGGSKQMSGEDLIAYAKTISQKAGDAIQAMVSRTEDGLKHLFTVFDNRVVAVSDELNLAVGQTGSGQKAPISLARTDLITNANVRDTELVNQLNKAGVPIEEIRGTVAKVTTEIEKGFKDLGNVTTVTAEDIDKIIQTAYDAVAAQDAKVKAAYEEMKKITATADPTARGGKQNRISIGKSYKENRDVYGKNMEVMVGGEENLPYATKGAFQITPAMAAAAKSTTAELAAVYKQLSDTVKLELSKINGDVELFTTKLLDEAKSAGIAGYELGSQAIKGIAKGTDSASDSKRAIQEGKNVVGGFVHAIQNGQDDALVAGKQLGDAGIVGVQQSTQRTRRVASRPQGAPYSAVAEGLVASRAAGGADAAARLGKLNNAIMAGSFALTGLAGVTQMFGGTLGKVSSVVFSLSGVLFALMSVTQALTQAKVLELAATRANNVANLMGSKGGFKGLFAGLTTFGARLWTLTKFISNFLGPWGKLAVGVISVAGAIVGWRKAQEAAKEKIEGLGNAALMSGKKIETLGEFFGVKPQTTRLERTGPSLILNQEKRSRVDELRASDGFKKEFGKDINALKGASNGQAELVLKSMAIQLKGKGFAKDQIDTILKALQEESGKTDLKIDFKSIDLSTKGGQAAFQKDVEKLGTSLGKQFGKGYSSETKTAISATTGEVITWTNEKLTKGLQKSLALTSKSFAGVINGLSGQLENGSINAEQFNQSFGAISETIDKMPKPQALLLMDNIIKNMPGPLAKSALGIKNVADQMLIAKAAALGITSITPAMIKALQTASTSSEGGAQRAATRVRAKIKEDMKAIQEVMDLVTKGTKTGTVTGAGEKSALQLAIEQLKKQQTELKNTANAYILLKKAGLDAATAMEYAKDPVIALGLATKGLSLTQVKALAALMKDIEKSASSEAVITFFADINKENKMKENFTGVAKIVSDMGGSLDDINNILGNPDLAAYLSDPMLTAEQSAARIKQYLDAIKSGKSLDLKIKLSTPEGMEQAFSDLSSQASDYYDILERNIRDKFEDPIKAAEDAAKRAGDAVKVIQDEIDVLNTKASANQRTMDLTINRPLDLIQQRSAVLSENMALIDHAAESINAKYDAQAKALSTVSQINQDIANQQKQQLDLASAITSGDISAAARAAQEMRSQSAASAATNASSALDAARQQELAGLTVNGMTADKIKAEQYLLERKSYALEQLRLPLVAEQQRLEDAIYAIQNGRLLTAQKEQEAADKAVTAKKDAMQVELDAIEAQREKWSDTQLAIDNAKIAAGKFDGVIAAAKDKVAAMKLLWDQISSKTVTLSVNQIMSGVGAIVGQGSNTPDPSNEVKINQPMPNVTPAELNAANVAARKATEAWASPFSTAFGGTAASTDLDYLRQYASPFSVAFGGTGLAMGGVVPSYFARGGMSRGTDTVPAMLSPGEFVVKKFAVDRFGVNNLKAINNGSYTPKSSPSSVNNNSNSVYNYGVTVNVSSSNASTDDITRAVMTQIRNIDNQRVRRQR